MKAHSLTRSLLSIQTPPLSISHSFDHSRTGSPSDPAMMPGTPISIAGSPHYILG